MLEWRCTCIDGGYGRCPIGVVVVKSGICAVVAIYPQAFQTIGTDNRQHIFKTLLVKLVNHYSYHKFGGFLRLGFNC